MSGTGPKVAAVVLAAGSSRRMGRPKMLLDLGGKPVLSHVLEALIAAGAEPVLVVTGAQREPIERLVAGFPGARTVHNAAHDTGGMLSSVQAGVSALPDGAPFLVALGDQPMVRARTVAALIASWRKQPSPVAVPVCDGRRGHPVLFDGGARAEILALGAEATLREVLARHAGEVLEIAVGDPFIRCDLDTPEDYERARRLYAPDAPMTQEDGTYAREG